MINFSRLYYFIVLTFLALYISAPAKAQGTRKYSVFKDGRAFVFAQDTVKALNGKSVLPVPQDALFGTLWLSSATSPLATVKTVAGSAGAKQPFSGLQEMLTHNTGKKVRLILAYQEPVDATISSVMSDYAVFKTKDRWISTNIDKIETLEFLEEPVVATQTGASQLEVEWANKNPNHFVSTAYMCNKLGWLPEYHITLTDEDENTAILSMRAKLVNDLEDLKNAELNFVAGAPEFRFGNMADPVAAAAGDLQQILSGLSQAQYYADESLISNNAYMNYSFERKPNAAGNMVAAAGAVAEDLYYYTVKNVSLGKGSRGTYPIIDAKIPVKHVYKVDMDNKKTFTGRTQRQTEYTVYHNLEISNNTAQPFTSGSAFLVKQTAGNTRPLAQNVLPYAPKGSKTQLQIASVPDVVVQDEEKEISREANINPKDEKNTYLAHMDGEINIFNHKEKEITLTLQRTIIGELLKSDIGWKASKNTDWGTGANAVNNVSWEVTLKPGESKSIRYKYKVTVNSDQ